MTIEHVTIIGTGTMGHGIAQVVAAAGATVHMNDVSTDAIEKGIAAVAANLAKGIEKGITEFRKREKAKARERDKLRKKALKEPQSTQPQAEQTQDVQTKKSALRSAWVPWLLLLASWAYFLIQLRLPD